MDQMRNPKIDQICSGDHEIYCITQPMLWSLLASTILTSFSHSPSRVLAVRVYEALCWPGCIAAHLPAGQRSWVRDTSRYP